jgi:ATP-binding cassette subfamily C protein
VEPYFFQQYASSSGTFARLNVFASVIGQLPYYIMEAVVFGGLLLFVVISLHGGENVATIIPLVSLYAFAGKRMMPALQIIYFSVTQIYYSQAILDKVYQDMIEGNLLGEPILFSSKPTSEEEVAITFQRELSLKDISFAYADNGKNVIDSLSLDIPKGSVIGFVGATGSGKTTLVDILLGLLIPQSGSILVDDIPLNRSNLHAWQRNIGYVPQEIYLSDDTLRKNIAFGVPDKDIDDNRVSRAARMAALDAFVNSLPQRYHTIIGERGVRLSGGQRQRIGLARALYRNPEVLVLDEATSALDGHTEERVLEAIRRASESRTVIMIAHRLNTLKDCDTIYMMEEGRFTASGTYDDLLRENRKFMDMAKVGSPV